MTSALCAAKTILVLHLVPCGQPSAHAERASAPRLTPLPRATFEEQCRQAQRRHAAKVQRLKEAMKQAGDAEEVTVLKHELARTLEMLDGKGHEARAMYAEILKEHPAYSRLHEVAYRLGELHTCIILSGTKPDREKAMRYYRLALEEAPEGRLIRQQAHLRLGGLYYHIGDRHKAKEHLEQAYRFDVTQLTVDEQKTPQRLRNQRLKLFRADSETIREAALAKFVAAHRVQLDPIATLMALDELEDRYPADERLQNMIAKEREMMLQRGSELTRELNRVLSIPGGVSPGATETSK